jgi:hypothetical protein
MKESEIIEFVKANIEPLQDFGSKSLFYRCSATLVDGLHLPCIVVKSENARVDLAIRRFQECHNAEPNVIKKIFGKKLPENSINDYRTIVSSFACSGNRINYYDIKSLDKSPFAIPPERMAEINGETSMGWTQFTARMKDGMEFEFGTRFSQEFFDMPNGYTAKDIVKITPAKRGLPRDFNGNFLREKPFFECYIDGI